jgi:hypothetical protein
MRGWKPETCGAAERGAIADAEFPFPMRGWKTIGEDDNITFEASSRSPEGLEAPVEHRRPP